MRGRQASERLCFVTGELWPLTAGGIGRLVAQLAARDARRGHQVHVACCFSGGTLDGFPGLHMHRLRLSPQRDRARRGFWAESVAIAEQLEALEQSGRRFDVIEFADYRGWAWATLQRKRLGAAFSSTTIRVRLHAPATLIQALEGSQFDAVGADNAEIERTALLEADQVIAPSPKVAEHVGAAFGLPHTWLARTFIEFPLEVAPPVPGAVDWRADIVFGTKLQRIKRPDLFVDGVVRFVERHPHWRGRALVLCHADTAAIAQLRARIPPQHEGRFYFDASAKARELARAPGVVWVIPSDFETLSLTAWEAAAAGATLVLNRVAPAFAEAHFVDGTNVHHFEGTAEALSAALERALSRPLREGPQPPSAVPPQRPRVLARQPRAVTSIELALWSGGGGAAMRATVRSVAREAPASVRTLSGPRWADWWSRVVSTARASTRPYLVVLERGMELVPGFLSRALDAMEANPSIGVLCPTLETRVGNLLETPVGVGTGAAPVEAACHPFSVFRVSALKGEEVSTEIAVDPFPGVVVDASPLWRGRLPWTDAGLWRVARPQPLDLSGVRQLSRALRKKVRAYLG